MVFSPEELATMSLLFALLFLTCYTTCCTALILGVP